jgi:branched-chain amino acid transport system substrate-binding protein
MRGRKKWMIYLSLLLGVLVTYSIATVCLAEEGVTANEIRIGSIMDLSGPIAFMGKGVSDGVKLYFKYINDQGGVHGRKLRLILEDDGYQPPRAVQACKKLITRNRVFCLFAILGSAQCNAMYPFLASRGIPLVLPATQNRDMGTPPRKYMFLADTDYTTQAKIAVEYIVEDMGVKRPKLACIYQDDTPGHDWRNGSRIAARHYGLDLLELSYKRGSVDFSSQVARCKDAGITHVLMWTLVREPAFILKEAKRIHYRAVYFTSTASMTKKILDLCGSAADYTKGLYCTGIVNDPISENTAGIRELKRNIAKYGMCKITNFYNGYGYQHAKTLVEGLRRAGKNLTREGLIRAFETFKNYNNGLLAPITWGPNRRAGGNAVKMFKAKNGYWKPIGTWRFSRIKG